MEFIPGISRLQDLLPVHITALSSGDRTNPSGWSLRLLHAKRFRVNFPSAPLKDLLPTNCTLKHTPDRFILLVQLLLFPKWLGDLGCNPSLWEHQEIESYHCWRIVWSSFSFTIACSEGENTLYFYFLSLISFLVLMKERTGNRRCLSKPR